MPLNNGTQETPALTAVPASGAVEAAAVAHISPMIAGIGISPRWSGYRPCQGLRACHCLSALPTICTQQNHRIKFNDSILHFSKKATLSSQGLSGSFKSEQTSRGPPVLCSARSPSSMMTCITVVNPAGPTQVPLLANVSRPNC